MSTHEQSSSSAEPPCKYTAVDKEENVRLIPWTPFFLRRSTIKIFLCSFLSVLAALIALYVYTERDGHSIGITTEERYYYLWTYGPTAVFTIITAGWTQVEYRAAQLMPWILMRQGPASPSESIFLDYISPWNIISLYQSLKKKHFLVSLCISGSLLLHGVTVFSTGLFELQSVPISHQTSLSVPNKFSDANFNSTEGRETTYAACSAFTDYNMTSPIGLQGPFVYTPFYPASSFADGNTTIPADRHYQADIDSIEPFLECHETTASWDTDSITRYTGYYEWTDDDSKGHSGFTSKTVEANTTVLSSPDGCRWKMGADKVNTTLLYYPDKTTIEVRALGCQGQDPLEKNMTNPGNSFSDWRIWAYVVDSTGAERSGDTVLRSVWPTPPYRGIICKPRFKAYRGPVDIWRQTGDMATSAEIRRKDLKTSQALAGFPAGKLLLGAYNSLSDSLKAPNTGYNFINYNNTSPEIFWNDMSLLRNATKDDMSCLMRQTLLNDLMEPELQNVEGVTRYVEQRLFVRVLSFGLMTGLLVCLIVVSIVLLCFFVPVTVCPYDTGSVVGMTSVFAQSPEFMSLFQNTDMKTESQMAETALAQSRYLSLETDGKFSIISQDGQESDRASGGNAKSSPEWWHPLASTWGIRISVITIPILVIVALEVVQHISTSSRGIAFIGDRSSFIHYVWVYIPALIMFAIRCLFTCVEFGVRVMQPYSALRGKSAPPETTIYENQLRKIAIYGLAETLQKQQWALAAATTSLFLAAMTPVVVSGLYTVDTSWPTSHIKLIQTNRWNIGDPALAQSGKALKWWNYASDLKDENLPGLILQLNLSYPQWTYNNLAFPGFNVTEADEIPEKGYIDVQIPALRSPLVCKEAPVSCTSNSKNLTPGYLTITCGTGDPCHGDGIEVTGNTNDTKSYFHYSDSPEIGSNGYKTLPSNCSTHHFLYGKWGKDFDSTEYHWYNCNATIEEVTVQTRLQIPSFSIDADVEPDVVPNSIENPFATHSWSFPDLNSLDTFFYEPEPTSDDTNALQSAMTLGIDGVPAEELLNPDVFSKRLETIWGIVTAQLLESNGLEDFQDSLNTSWLVHPATSNAPIFDGTFHDGRTYLVQSKISTRILDGLLAAMIICALVASFSMRTKRILPKSPCSVASVASFVAGSKFLNIMRDVAPGERNLSQKRFSMGWWKVEPGTVQMTSESIILPTDGKAPAAGEKAQPNSQSNELVRNHSTQSGSSSPSLVRSQDEEFTEIRVGSPAEGEERANHRAQSARSHSSVSSLSGTDDREAEIERTEVLTRFGIDIDGYRPLLDDVE
ncbi:hypothetical protein PENSTE_c006G07048 [Penicillium steckii]|uniref:Uncharacterized protein n=1 Tax=Penicillium steckii TaxID=303698 RepID=A0A1V6TH46_9EURO|nr:hypothetical protein PENSTE_c006G07048 [Penicillium steckii]